MQRLLPFIAILFALALLFVYIRPTYTGSIKQTRDQIQSYDNALAAADRFQEKEAELTQAKAQIPAESLNRLNEFLPDGVDNVQLILDLNALAARSGMTLSDFDTKNQTGGDVSSQGQSQDLGLVSSSPIDSLNLTFKAAGTYSSFRSFLAGVEGSLRPLDIVNVDLQKTDTGVYSYSITTRIYWLR